MNSLALINEFLGQPPNASSKNQRNEFGENVGEKYGAAVAGIVDSGDFLTPKAISGASNLRKQEHRGHCLRYGRGTGVGGGLAVGADLGVGVGRYVSIGFGPISSAVGMFEPVTITSSIVTPGWPPRDLSVVSCACV